ncbi:MAG: MFS transporter [Enterobacterales bacterium]|nr:MFS transporter [Enterobacterales bacterium]
MKNINPNIIAIGWVSFFTDMASAMLVPILPIYLVSVLNQGADKLGMVLAISSFISYFLRYIAGYLSDKLGRVKSFLLLGYLISAIAKPLFSITSSWQSVAGLKSFERLGKAIRTAPKDVLISHFSAKNQSGKGFGFHKMMDITGELVGSFIIFSILYFYDFDQASSSNYELIKNIFLATAIPGSIGFIIALIFVEDIGLTKNTSILAAEPSSTSIKEQPNRPSSVALKKQMLFFFLFSFLLMEEAFFILQSQKVMLGLIMIPLLLMFNKLVQTLSSYQIGLIADKISPNKLMPVTYVFALLALACFAQESKILLWFGFGFLGLYSVTGLNLMRSLIAKQTTRTGHYYGLFYTGMAIALSLGALFWGYLWQLLGGYLAINMALMLVAFLFIAFLLLTYFSLYFDDE